VPQKEDRPDDRTISDRIAPVLEAAAERIHYAEGRRANYVTMGGALLAAAITIFPFAWSAIDLLVLRWSATFGAAAMFIVGLAAIWVFGQQTNRYPWTSATKTWKWFYRDALPAWDKFKTPWLAYFPIFWRRTGPRVKAEYENQLSEFKTRMAQLKDDRANADQDLEQLYVLHINEGYKNLHLTHLRSLLNRGIYLILVGIVAGALYGWHLQTDALKTREFHADGTGYSQKVEIKLVVSPLSAQSEFIGHATLSNIGPTPIGVGDLIARDAEGWSLPLSNVAFFEHPDNIEANAVVDFGFSFEMPRQVADRIRSLQIDVK
jgi:hypothetical protein